MAKKKHLVIVESAAKAKTIKKILGPDYEVTASYGHVMDLPKSGLNIDLETFEPTYEIIGDKAKVVSALRAKAAKSDKIYLCADMDREGEFIALSLAKILNLKDDALRVTFNEITKKAIIAAFKIPRRIDKNLVNAQQARRLLDRIVGYKLTNILYQKILRGLTGGRVQSVAAKIIAERELEIQAFEPVEYWTIKGQFGKEKFPADLREFNSDKVASSAKDLSTSKLHIKDKKQAAQITKSSNSPKTYTVDAYVQKPVQERSGPPFATSTLQMAAANRLGFDASRTMRIAQQLYEGANTGGGLITYMRTDSFNISNDARYAAKDYIEENFGEKFYPNKPNFFKSKKGAQQAHECIRPTDPAKCPNSMGGQLSIEQRRLYELIWNRFMASQMSPAEYQATTCDLRHEKDGAVFRATARIKQFDGWTVVYGSDHKNTELPELKVGEEVTLAKASSDQHFTQPPPRYNDASLVKKLEVEGIGRPSTYAAIIKTIQVRNYVTKEGTGGKAPLKATHLGIAVTESLKGFFSMMDIGFTRDMEEKLDSIEEGKIDYKELLCTFWKDFQEELRIAKKDMPSAKEGKPSKYDCPKCKSNMTQRLSQHGIFFKCEKEACSYIMDGGEDGTPQKRKDEDPTGIKCDTCGDDVVLSKGRFGPYLRCVNYVKKIEKIVNGKKKSVPVCDFTMNMTTKNAPRRKVVPIRTDLKCDKCGQHMVIRVASRKKIPAPFVGCSGFPKCREVSDMPPELKKDGEKLMKTFRENRRKDETDLMTLQKFLLEHGLEP